jgi:hypothetical protein
MLTFFKNKVREVYIRFKAAFVKRMTQRIIERELRSAHALELSSTPGNEWAVIREKHAHQIAAVRDGRLPMPAVDRRSWQWPYLPSSLSRIRQPIVKMTPYNIRRFMKSPVPRRCINLIKNSITQLDWAIEPEEGTLENASPETKERIAAATRCWKEPNAQDDYQTLLEMGIDDMMTFGAFVIEPGITPDPERPIKMWVVDSSTIRIFPTWRESDSDELHYAQMTGLRGERGIIGFYDDELMYIRDNPSVETPFGLGRGEIAFNSVNALIGVQEMSGRAGADQTHRTWLWWEQAQYANQIEVIRRHITNDIEGQAKINLQTGMKAPTVIEVTPTQESDLLLNWQEFLLVMIADSFDLSAMTVGKERDVNRSTGEVLDDRDFRSAVVPLATKLSSYFTRFIFRRKLGWKDVKFSFLNLDDPDSMTKMTIQSQLFQANAQTPNGIRKAMGMPTLPTPWADLTQIEMIVANMEVASNQQDQNAEKQFTRNQSGQQQMYEQYQQSQSQGEGGEQQGAGAGKGLPSLKPPKLPSLKPPMSAKPPTIKPPKAPMLGKAQFSGSQLATMTPGQLESAIAGGFAPPQATDIKDSIGQSQLSSISKELRQYLDELEEFQEEKNQDKTPKPSAKDYKDQQQKFKKAQHKQALVERTVYNIDKDGLPKTRAGQGIVPGGKGKEIPNYVSDSRVARKRPSRPRRQNNDVRY